jgi:hypothetical protein
MRATLLLVVMVAASACGGRNNFECSTDSSCDLSGGGRCIAASTGTSWCAYPDPECPGGYRYSDQDVGDGLAGRCAPEMTVDAGADAGVDAPVTGTDAPPGQNKFDIAYVNDFRLGSSATTMTTTGWFRVANLGAQALDVTAMTITNVSDDHPNTVVTITIDKPGDTALPPGFSDGELTGNSYTLVMAKMSEPVRSGAMSLIKITADPIPPSGTWFFINITATITIGNAYAIMPLQLVQSGTGTAATPNAATRVSSQAQ